MDMKITIKSKEDMQDMQLGLLIRIAAHQQALGETLIRRLAINEKDVQDMIDEVNRYGESVAKDLSEKLSVVGNIVNC